MIRYDIIYNISKCLILLIHWNKARLTLPCCAMIEFILSHDISFTNKIRYDSK